MAQIPEPKRLERASRHSVLVVEDQPIVRERLRQLITHEACLQLSGETDNPRAAFELIASKEPDLVVTGLALKGAHGLEFIKDLHLQYPDIRVLVFSIYDESLYAERAIRAGADGFITKRQPTKELIRAIYAVLKGEIYLGDKIAGETVRRFFLRSPLGSKSDLNLLSDRELEIFELIGNGCSTKRIAKTLHVGPKTVETYRSRIKVKLGLGSGAELVSRAQMAFRQLTTASRAAGD